MAPVDNPGCSKAGCMSVTRARRKQHLLRRKSKLSAMMAQLNDLDRRFVWLRIASFATAWLGALLARMLVNGAAWLVIFAGFLVVFLGVVVLHRRLDGSRRRFQDALTWTETQLARMDLAWEGIPLPAETRTDSEHPFAVDLNLIGSKSVQQLLDTCFSMGGSRRLLEWLLTSEPQRAEIAARQALVQEMLPLSGFRRQLVLEGMAITRERNEKWDSTSILSWLQARTQPAEGSMPRSLRILLTILLTLSALNVILFVLQRAGVLSSLWIYSLAVYAIIYLSNYRAYSDIFNDAYSLSVELRFLAPLLRFLEKYPYPKGSGLAKISEPLWKEADTPSKFLRKIGALTSAASLQNNQLLWLLLNALLPWGLIVTALLQRYQEGLAQVLPRWLGCWYQLEALQSLANFAWLNPDYHFAELRQPGQGAVFQAKGLGHPLIAAYARVGNDFTLAKAGEIALVTGSNMAGKSTFLRTLGVNTVLAFAGSVVCAEQLSLIPLRVFTVIQVSDSLSDGFSYFYAEVRRLKQLLTELQAAEDAPLFFLIDEIFRGTNNQERRIGSQAYVRALLKENGVGVISTHDLELVKLADENARVINYNFRDAVENGKMVFDYRLREGPSPTTNALKIMAMEGLPVGEE